MTPIVPAIIPTSEKEVREYAAQLRFSPELHLDVVDGVFVPAISWPYQPAGIPLDVKADTDSYTLEVDLMVADPVAAATAWLEAGADMLVFHVEGIPLDDFKAFTTSNSVSVGIAASNDTSLETLRPYIAACETIQLMGIATIGSQGQAFDERVLERIALLKAEFPQHPITVDGSVNQATIVRLKEAGADRFICGSAIVKADDPAAAHRQLSELIN